MADAQPTGSLPVSATDPSGATIWNPPDFSGLGQAVNEYGLRASGTSPAGPPDQLQVINPTQGERYTVDPGFYGAGGVPQATGDPVLQPQQPAAGQYGWRDFNFRQPSWLSPEDRAAAHPQLLQADWQGGNIAQMAQQVPAAPQDPDIFAQARQQYPILNNPAIHYKYTPRSGVPGGLEAWPPGETGTPDRPRPGEFPADQYGIEVYNAQTTRPIDVLGDVVSHFLVNSDPTLKDYYSRFSASLSPEQEARLHGQYQYSQRHEGEKRPYAKWREDSGLPAYFRGYPFQQWSKDFNDKAYTPDQRLMLDNMMKYLSGK